MKKFTAVFMAFACLICLSSCKSTPDNSTVTTPPAAVETAEPQSEKPTMGDISQEQVLVVYFSHNDNTKTAAEYIANATGGTLFEIKTEKDYPDNTDELESVAQNEFNKNIRPVLSQRLKSVSGYALIYVCYPVWQGTMPMAMYTFLEDCDLRDRFITPVCINENGSLEQSLKNMQALLGGSYFCEELIIKNSEVNQKKDEIIAFALDILDS